MELYLLEAFVTLAEERHFGRAARRLHVSQPALTYQLRRLEEELATPLFTRTTRKVELTRAGEELLDGARTLLDDSAVLAERVRQVARGEVGIVRIGCVASALQRFAPAVVRDMRARHPLVRFSLTEKKTGDQLADLLAGRLDVGLVHAPSVVEVGIEVEALFTQPVVVALPDDHPLAKQDLVAIGELAASPFVLFPRSLEPDTYDLFVAACVAAGFAPRVTQEAENIESLLALVAAGLGVAFVPSSVAAGPRMPAIAFRPLLDPPLITTALAWPRDRDHPTVDEFRRLARAAARALPDASANPAAPRPAMVAS
ncbi:MAG TPA: LysR family transcriptional regulator [Candidatus Deferrimicrobium sp.]|nr:LysR family transcriptional regulator [Candidatus Deferrimicrobium sp.]